MASKELWKAKVGFQKQKLIALHLAFQCHVALSHTAERKPLPRQGAWGGVGQGFHVEEALAGVKEDHLPPPGAKASPLRSWRARGSEPSTGLEAWVIGKTPFCPGSSWDSGLLPSLSESQSGPLLTVPRGILGIRSFL